MNHETPQTSEIPRNLAAAVARPKLVEHRVSLGERLFVGPFFTALWFTFSRLLRRKVTRQYPEQKLVPGAVFRGVPVLVARSDGQPRCVACGLCEFVCPPRAIDIVPGETDDPIERAPREFAIDMLRCIECSYCEEVCPEEAIVMSQEYECVGRRREDFAWDLRRLLRSPAQVAERLAWVRRTYRRWDESADSAPPPSGVFGDPAWAGREPPAAPDPN